MGIKLKNPNGIIEISGDVFTTISGWLAMNCFGVRGMAERSVSDGLVRLLHRGSVSKGIKVTFNDNNSVNIDLHIIVEHGVNIPAISNSIMSEVGYMVEKLTGVKAASIDVYVDGMMAAR
jgi:uncharacterized alkaline shock family protein YloU